MSNINVVIEVQDATAFAVHPVVGRSGKTYGAAVYCPRRGRMAFRMTAEDWREAREDICTARHRFYPLVIDFEEAEVSQPVLAVTEETPVVIAKAAPKKRTAAKVVAKATQKK